MTITPQELLAVHDRQLRARVPEVEPVGVVFERNDNLVRVHYGTHGLVDHRSLRTTDLAGLVEKQQRSFAERFEPVEWKVYDHDGPALPKALTAAGFTPGWRRPLLIAPVIALAGPVSPRVYRVNDLDGRQQQIRAAAGANQLHRVRLDELEAGGSAYDEVSLLGLGTGNSIEAVGWAHHLDKTDFIEIGGLTGPHAEFLPLWAAWCREQRGGFWRWDPPEAKYVVAEADGDLYEMLIGAGFQQVTTVETYHWQPAGPSWPTRPVRMLLRRPEYRTVWDAVDELLSFKPSTTDFPGIVDPPPSMTWSLDTIPLDGLLHEHFEAAVRQALIAVTAPDELLRWLDWNHPGYEFDPRRVGRPGYPEWPGQAYPDGDYYLYLTTDLRLGTFGHPWEQTFCVFGAELLAELETELTEMLGAPIRRS